MSVERVVQTDPRNDMLKVAIASFLFSRFLLRLSPDVSQCFPFVDRHMIGFVALNEVLRFLSRSVMHIAFDPYVGDDSLDDDAANPPSF